MFNPGLMFNHRRGGNTGNLEYELPRGPLTKLMLAHVLAGHEIITQSSGDSVFHLFTTRRGKPFSNVTFVHTWKALMVGLDTKQKYFPPSAAR